MRITHRWVVASAVMFAPAASPSFAGDKVTIIRDTWGIPHVFAHTDRGAFYGAGYATASDRMYQMHRMRRVIQGRLAELVGLMHSGNKTTADQDANMRHRAFYKYAQRRAANLDPETLAMLEAYSDGVNRYIRDHQDELLYLFDGEVPEPWTPADCLAIWDRIADFFSGFPADEARLLHEFEELEREHGREEAIRRMTPKRIYDEDAAVVKREDLDPKLIAEMEEYARQHSKCEGGDGGGAPPPFSDEFAVPKFSHAWVVGGSRTTTGAAVLNSDPQTSVASPAIWHEVHVRGETFDARGVGIAGSPGFLIGWNTHVAWGLTALGADQADLFRLKMRGSDKYEYDGEVYDLDISEEQILVKGGAPVAITVKDTIIGPVVTPLVKDVKRGEEYVLKAIPQWDLDKHTAQAVLPMIRAADVESFLQAIKFWRGPSANCVFGDSNGAIGYSVLAAIPTRSGCSPLAGMIAQDGGESRFDWQRTVPYRLLPHVADPSDGALFSGNHLPIGSWYPIPIRLGTGGGGDTNRSWRLRERLLEGPPVFTPQEVLDVHYESTEPTRREIVRAGYHLRDVQGARLSRSALSALNILEDWYANGAKSLTSEPHQAAAFHLNTLFREGNAPELTEIYGGGGNGLAFWLKTLKRKLDENPRAELDPPEVAYINASLTAGWDTAVRNYGRDPEEWQSAFARGPGTAKIKFFDTLERFGSLDPQQDKTYAGLKNVDGGTIWSQKGESYSQWVNLADVDSSLALLPTGSSENPESEFFNDQAPLWVEGDLRAAPLDRKIIEEMATSIEYLRVGTCTDAEVVKVKCKQADGDYNIKVKVKRAAPGAETTFRLDDDPNTDRRRKIKENGKANMRFRGVAGGRHTAKIVECGAEGVTECR